MKKDMKEILRTKMIIFGLTSAMLLTLTGCEDIKAKIPGLGDKKTEVSTEIEDQTQQYLDKIASLEKEIEDLKSDSGTEKYENQISYAINDKINYMIAERMAKAHDIELNDKVLTEYVKNLFESSEKQTADTIANNPKTVVAIVGYKDYGRNLALDYVMQEVIYRTAKVNDEDKNNEELINDLKEKYKNNSLVKKTKNEEQLKNVLLKLSAEDKVKEVLEMEMKTLSGQIYEELLKQYNPTYYNALLQGNEIQIPDETPSQDTKEYKKSIGYTEPTDKSANETAEAGKEAKQTSEPAQNATQGTEKTDNTKVEPTQNSNTADKGGSIVVENK